MVLYVEPSRVTPYKAPARARTTMTDEEAVAMRSQVPDNPVALPPDHLACEGCGVAVDGPVTSVTPVPPKTQHTVPSAPVSFSRCPQCTLLRDTADAYVSARPALAARLGEHIARERVSSVLFGLAILGKPVPDDLSGLLPRLHPAAHVVWFRSPSALSHDRCSPYPWAHVTLGQRAALRTAYAAVLRDRLALTQPPVAVACPSHGCLLCGVAAVRRSAIEVSRGGGESATVHTLWRAVTTLPTALGGQGPDHVFGHVCPACAEAIAEAGAVGPSARERAVVEHVRATLGDAKADRLRTLLTDDFPPSLPAWGAVTRPASATPWGHLRRVIQRL